MTIILINKKKTVDRQGQQMRFHILIINLRRSIIIECWFGNIWKEMCQFKFDYH